MQLLCFSVDHKAKLEDKISLYYSSNENDLDDIDMDYDDSDDNMTIRKKKTEKIHVEKRKADLLGSDDEVKAIAAARKKKRKEANLDSDDDDDVKSVAAARKKTKAEDSKVKKS